MFDLYLNFEARSRNSRGVSIRYTRTKSTGITISLREKNIPEKYRLHNNHVFSLSSTAFLAEESPSFHSGQSLRDKYILLTAGY
jgi:hypothetical protein